MIYLFLPACRSTSISLSLSLRVSISFQLRCDKKARFTDSSSLLPAFVEQPLYGGSDWAAGYSEEESAEEIQQEVQTEVASVTEGYSTLQKGFLFAAIVGCVALYVRITKKRNLKDLGYEKTMA